MIVEKNKVVSLSYELKVKGETVEQVGADSPLMFLFGAGNLLPKFEENLNGLKLNEGFDMVSGWRSKRKDPGISKNLLSRIASMIEHIVTGLDVHDYGCTLKAYRRRVVKTLSLHSQHHRFIPAIANWEGFTVAEIEVAHHPRKYGKTKYGLTRLYRGFVDLIGLSLWYKHKKDPQRFIRDMKAIRLSAYLAAILVVLAPVLELGVAPATMVLLLGIIGTLVVIGVSVIEKNGILPATIDLFERSLSMSKEYRVARILN